MHHHFKTEITGDKTYHMFNVIYDDNEFDIVKLNIIYNNKSRKINIKKLNKDFYGKLLEASYKNYKYNLSLNRI